MAKVNRSKVKKPARKKRADNLADFAGPKADTAKLKSREQAAKTENAKAGHNSGEVPAELIAHHAGIIIADRKRWMKKRDEAADAKALLGNRYKAAKESGVDTDALKTAIELGERSTAEVVAETRNLARYLKILESPLADKQLSLFSLINDAAGPAPLEPLLQGEHAGKNGESIDSCSHKPGSAEFEMWNEGWRKGQASLADGLKN